MRCALNVIAEKRNNRVSGVSTRRDIESERSGIGVFFCATPTDKIREVIGSGGKVIREIVETSGAKVDISDDGTIKIASPDGASIQKAYDMIYSIVAEPEVGSIYTGTVVKLVDFGAFVNFFGKRDGLVHVSQIENRRLNHPSDVLKEGQEVKVKLMGFDDRGKVRLSMKVVDQDTGEEIVEDKKES